ncbi:hypothetical protein M9H77_02629 [Catharanthus roseus]|uniref:Uncharacterized protein n=1 Tax=Catharanthus roseus TaxID=4058 RepID=A0ACC0C982_CATRO|nr:hypothetical protein M9H77_02629 [Catharanthus roseus]
MVKDEEVAQRFVNGSWRKLINELDEVEFQRKLEVLKTRWQSRPDFLHYLFSIWLNPFAHKFCRVWTSQLMHFGVETMNRAESEHSVLKLWLSTCHGDLDTVFLNIDSLIQAQVAEIKYSLEISRLKEKYGAKSNPILKNLCNKISHLGLKKKMDKLKKARQLVEELASNRLHYLRKSHGLPCALRRLIKGVIHPVLPDDPSQPLSNPPETTVTKGRRKTNSTIRDKSHWECISIAHRKIGKSSYSSSGFGSGSGSGSNPSPRGRGRPPRSGRSRDKGRGSSRSSLSTVVSPDSPPVPFPFKNTFPGFTYQFIQNWKNVAGDENHWIEIRRRMIFDLRHHMRVYEQLFGSVERVTELIMQINWEDGSEPRDH